MRLHSVHTCWASLPWNLYHNTCPFAYFLASRGYHNLTWWQKHGDAIVILMLHHVSMLQNLQKAPLTAQHKWTCGTRSLCKVPKSPKAFQKYHWLDIAGPLLATWREWWSFSLCYLPLLILHCSLSTLVPQQDDSWWMASPRILANWLLLSVSPKGRPEVGEEPGWGRSPVIPSQHQCSVSWNSCVPPELKLCTGKTFLLGSTS